jgi:hypothetical protein
MAKRRNLKKEKALRNQAYARKFRKKSSSGRFGRRRFDGGNRMNDAEGDSEGAMSENEGAADN